VDQQHEFYTREEIRERLSISTLVFWQYRPIGRDALAELARRGIRRIELLESPDQFDLANARSMRLMGDIFRSCGIDVAAYHAFRTSFSDVDTEADRVKRVDRCRGQIDTMLGLGGRVWGCHAGAAEPVVAKSYEELARHVEGTEAVITVENFTAEGVGVEDRVAFLDEMAHPQVGMILDIGHVRDTEGANPMCVPGGPTQVIETCGERLFHVHLHGFKGGADHHPPFVEGDEIQWVEIFRSLRAIAYRGPMNFEPSGEPAHADAIPATGSVPERIVEMEAETR